MFGERSFFFRLLAALLLIGLLVAAGTLVFRAGFSQGYASGAAISSGEGGQAVPRVGPGYPYYPYYPGFFGPRFGFFPFFPIIGFFFFGLLFFGLMRFLFWPRRWGHPGYWRGYGPPPWAQEGPQGAPGTPEGQPQSSNRPESQG